MSLSTQVAALATRVATEFKTVRTEMPALGGGIDPADVGYDVVILAGQSNMSGSGSPVLTDVFDVPDPRVWQYAGGGTYQGKIIRGIDPLENPAPDASSEVGPGMEFARQWVRCVPVNRKVLLVPTAIGGSNLVGGPWAVGGSYYNQTVSLANAAIVAAGPNARVVAILWHQGEGDSVGSVSGSAYGTALDAMIAGFRSSITGAAEAAFLLGGMVPAWRNAPNGTSLAIHTAHVGTPARVANTYFVDGPTGHGEDTGGIHYDAYGAREIGRLMCEALWLEPGVPAQVSTLSATPGNTQVALLWSAPFANPTINDYVVNYRTSPAGSWATFADGTSATAAATVTGLTNGTSYDFRVAAVNALGQGAWSGIGTAAPALPVVYYANEVTADNPTVYLPLGEAAVPILDQKGVASPVVVGSGTLGAAGIGDRATSFDIGGSGYVNIGQPTALNNIGAFTIEALIRPDALGDRFIAARDNAASNRTWRLAIRSDNRVEFYKFTNGVVNVIDSEALVIGTTYHIVATYDGANLRIYRDGVLRSTAATTGLLAASATDITIGASSIGSFGFDGRFAGVALYNTALSGPRILAHAQAAGRA